MQRPDYTTLAPEAIEPLHHAAHVVAQSGLEPALIALVQLRASQINGCAFCIALHVREAEALGETSDRLHGLAAWREASWYSDRERAAIEWAESVTLVAQTHVPDDVYERVSRSFSAQELAFLTLAVATINSWNRFAIAFRASPDRAEEVFQWLRSRHAVTP